MVKKTISNFLLKYFTRKIPFYSMFLFAQMVSNFGCFVSKNSGKRKFVHRVIFPMKAPKTHLRNYNDRRSDAVSSLRSMMIVLYLYFLVWFIYRAFIEIPSHSQRAFFAKNEWFRLAIQAIVHPLLRSL